MHEGSISARALHVGAENHISCDEPKDESPATKEKPNILGLFMGYIVKRPFH